jgi:hypothetical protein
MNTNFVSTLWELKYLREGKPGVGGRLMDGNSEFL